MDFFEIFTSGRHHTDMKILKIYPTFSKFLTFTKNDNLMMIGGDKTLHFLRQLLLKIISGFRIIFSIFFDSRNSKNDIEIDLKRTSIEL